MFVVESKLYINKLNANIYLHSIYIYIHSYSGLPEGTMGPSGPGPSPSCAVASMCLIHVRDISTKQGIGQSISLSHSFSPS